MKGNYTFVGKKKKKNPLANMLQKYSIIKINLDALTQYLFLCCLYLIYCLYHSYEKALLNPESFMKPSI